MRTLVFVIAAFLAAPVFAQDTTGTYVGVTVGNASYVEKADGLLTQSDFDDSASAARLYGGYRFGRLALELGYAETDGIQDTIDVVQGTVVPVDIANDFSMTTLRAIGFFPIRQERLPFISFNVFVGAGVYDASLKSGGNLGGLGLVSTESSNDGGTALLGFQVDFPKVSVRAEYEWFDTESSVDITSAGVGLIFRF